MNKKMIMAVAILSAFICLTGIVVSAVSATQPQEEPAPVEEIVRLPIEEEKIYYAYYNTGSGKGAVAFCLDNEFVSYGETDKNIKICTKNADGVFTVLHEIAKESVGTWFYGKSELSVATCDGIKNLLGGLSAVGVTVQSDKTNVAFELSNQPLDKNTVYYIYIPEDYFADADGIGNAGAYIEIPTDKINGYTGDPIEDLMTVTEGLYDVALFGIESIGGILS